LERFTVIAAGWDANVWVRLRRPRGCSEPLEPFPQVGGV
jgi:hypothetical protein